MGQAVVWSRGPAGVPVPDAGKAEDAAARFRVEPDPGGFLPRSG